MPADQRTKQVALVLALLLAGAAVARWWLARGQDYPSYDGCYYLNLARDMVTRGELRYSTFPPGFPALVAMAMVGLGTDSPEGALRAAQLVNAVAGLGLGGMSFLLVRRVTGPWWGVLAAALTWALPLPLRHSFSDLSQLTFACAMLGGLLLHPRRPLAAGCLLGFSYLVRPEGLLVLLALIAREAWHRRRPWRLMLGAAAFVVPYLVHVFAVTGQPLPSSKWGFLETSLETVGMRGMFGLYAQNAGVVVRMVPQWLGLPVFLLALWGIGCRDGSWRLGLLPIVVLPLFTFAMELGYWLPMLPLLLLAGLLGGADLTRRLPPGLPRRVTQGVLLALALGALVQASWTPWRELRIVDESFPGLRATGRWLRTEVERDALVAAGKPYASFWAGCQFVRIPPGLSTEGIIGWCQQQRADYLVANGDVALRLLPGLLPLVADPADSVSGLRRIGSFTIEGRPDQTTQLYRVVAPDADGVDSERP